MDEYTQALMERTRQRRQDLEKKLSEGPSPRRKRSNPLSEIQGSNRQVTASHDDDDDSPSKRACVREVERQVKPDTPAIRSVQSRMNQLAAKRDGWQDGAEDGGAVAVAAGPIAGGEECTPAGRRGRLAALAHNRDDWEDDLSRHTPKPAEKEKKVWRPPVTPAAVDAAPAPAEGGSPVTYKVWRADGGPVTKSPTHVNSASPSRVAHSPAKPARVNASTARVNASPVRVNASPARVNASTARVNASPARVNASPVRSSAVVEKNVVSQLTVQLKCQPSESGAVVKGAVVKGPGVAAVMRQKDAGDEPTARPVSARMAHWQKKIDDTEGDQTPKTASVIATTPRAARTPAAARATWTPGTPAAGTPAGGGRSPGGGATRQLRERLEAGRGTWQDGAIAAQTRRQRQADIAVLDARWHNGILADGHHAATETASGLPATAVPPAPPVPAPTPAAPVVTPTRKPAGQRSPVKGAKPRTPISAQREEGRQRLRSEFEDKLKVMGFDVQSDTATVDLTPQRQKDKAAAAAQTPAKTSTATPTAATPPVVRVSEKRCVTTTFRGDPLCSLTAATKLASPLGGPTVATPSGSSSIYGLVKKQGAAATRVAGQTPARTAVAGNVAGKGPSRDSFDSDDSAPQQRRHQVAAPAVRRESLASTQSGDSETRSSYSESQTDDYTSQTDDYTSQTDDYTSQTDDYTTADDYPRQRADYAEADYSSGGEESSSGEEGEDYGDDDEIDGMLEEAMGEEEQEEGPVPTPRHQRAPRTEQHNSQAADKRVTFASGESSSGGATSSSYASSSSESGHAERPVVYSVDMYRAAKSKKNPTPTVTIVRQSEHQQQQEREEELPFIPEVSAKQRLQELRELVSQEQNVIMQTSNALNQCCGINSTFARSTEAVECHRLLLMSCKKREMYLEETHRLRGGRPPPRAGPHGSLTITNISLPLKQNFNARPSSQSADNHYLMVLFRHDTHVIFTQMVSTADSSSRSVDFPNLIKLSAIRQDFRVDVEVYSMYVAQESSEPTPKKKRGATPKKKFLSTLRGGGGGAGGLQSPGGPLAVRSTNFHLLTSLAVTVDSLNKTQFALDQVPFTSPLQGSIHMRLTCLMESCVEEQGFLTMFEDVCGFGAWHRRWCILRGHSLAFWKYPNDEKIKDPIGCIDLKHCITEAVGLVSREFCARPNTFELKSMRRQLRGEADTLVTQCYNTMSTTKHWISADTKEDRVHWCRKLNQALHNTRVWHSDAMRPVKVTAPRKP